jgi:hypothetical protein
MGEVDESKLFCSSPIFFLTYGKENKFQVSYILRATFMGQAVKK